MYTDVYTSFLLLMPLDLARSTPEGKMLREVPKRPKTCACGGSQRGIRHQASVGGPQDIHRASVGALRQATVTAAVATRSAPIKERINYFHTHRHPQICADIV